MQSAHWLFMETCECYVRVTDMRSFSNASSEFILFKACKKLNEILNESVEGNKNVLIRHSTNVHFTRSENL